MTTEENIALVRRLIDEVWNTGDYDHLDALVAPSLAESMKQMNQVVRTASPDFEHHIDDIFADGNKVVLRWTGRGTHQGVFASPIGPIPPTGKQVTLTAIHIFLISGGKISERWAEADMLGLLQQMDAIPSAKGS